METNPPSEKFKSTFNIDGEKQNNMKRETTKAMSASKRMNELTG